MEPFVKDLAAARKLLSPVPTLTEGEFFPHTREEVIQSLAIVQADHEERLAKLEEDYDFRHPDPGDE